MKRKKTLQELTIKDNFMFGAVMCDEEHCRRLLEISLGFSIERVKVSKEKSIIYHPQYKGIRLDVYAKDEKSTHYNVEMQAVKKDSLFRRARYYHSQIDMELLLSGAVYSELPNSYVIFICDFDPFECGKYRYTIHNRCMELNHEIIDDGNITVFLSTKGTNIEEVPRELVKFLDFVGADLDESTEDFKDDFVKSLQNSVASIKNSREMEERFMLLELMLQDERRDGKLEGKAEAIINLLEEIDVISENIKKTIMSEKNLSKLDEWIKLAAKSNSIEQFLSKM